MKIKIHIVVAILLSLSILQCSDNDYKYKKNKLNGYKDVEWGTPLNEVKTKFGDIKFNRNIAENCDEYYASTSSYDSDSLTGRWFTFINSNLVKVEDRFRISEENINLFVDKLVEKYGKYDHATVKDNVLYSSPPDGEYLLRAYTWNMPKTKLVFRITEEKSESNSGGFYTIRKNRLIFTDYSYIKYIENLSEKERKDAGNRINSKLDKLL